MGNIAHRIVGSLLASALGLATPVAFAAAPIAKPDTAVTKSGVAVSIPVMVNDRDPDGDTLTIGSFPQASRPANGSVSKQGRFAVYTPAAGFSGTDSFSYRLKDSTNAWSRAARVTVTVTAIGNTAPVARADSGNTTSPNPVTVNLLANDTDADGDVLTVTANTTPANGTVTRTGGSVTYTPDAGFNGTDSFGYTVSDGKGGTATGSATVSVAPKPNTAPVAGADNASTVSPDTIAVNLLGNDTDPDGDTLTVTGTTPPGNGTVTLSGGSATYTPAAGFSGTDTFGYFLDDGRGGTAIGTVTVSVSAPALPEAANASAVLSWNAPTTRADGSPLTMADIDGYEIYVLSESTGETATITLDDGAASSYTLDNLPADTYHFSMAAKDTQGNLSALSAVVSKTITP